MIAVINLKESKPASAFHFCSNLEASLYFFDSSHQLHPLASRVKEAQEGVIFIVMTSM